MLDSLKRPADGGDEAVPFDQWRTVASWSRDHAEATGDARYCSIARALGTVASAFDEWGVLDTSSAAAIDHEVRTQLPAITTADEPGDGPLLARRLREDLVAPAAVQPAA